MTASLSQNPIDVLKRVEKMANDMVGMLRAQRDLLALRGIDLPLAASDGLAEFAGNTQTLATHLGQNETERGQLRELARTSQIVNSALNLDQVLSDVIDTVISLIRAERGFIVLRNKDTHKMDVRIARNMQQTDLAGELFTVSATVVDRVAASGEAIVSINAQEDPRFAGSDSVADYMLRSLLCVPLKHKGEVTGVIYLDNRLQQGVFGGREESLVSAFANQAAVAIENARLFEGVRANLAEITAIRDFMDNVFDSIGSGVVAADRREIVTALNRAATEILAVAEEKGIGHLLWEVMPKFYDGFEALLAKVRDNNRAEFLEVEPRIEARGQVSLSVRLSPLRDTKSDQRAQGVAIVLEDLTESKQEDARLGMIRRYLSGPMLDNIQTIDKLELGGVERVISVLFCDVRGFTTFSEQLPPEELMLVINKYLSLSSTMVNAQGGIVDKFMGDAVVGLYNTQLNPHEDHALRAARAALQLAERVTQLHRTLPPEQRLFYGISVHSGSAVLGNVGSPSRKEFTAIGDTLEMAKLLQENALGGEVLISDATLQILRQINGLAIQAEPLQPRKLKDQYTFTVMHKLTKLG
jgi:adenylate cyclase